MLSVDPTGGVYEKNYDDVDFYMKRDGMEYYFELKTAKPNIGNFISIKEELLQWVARKRKPVYTFLVFPYNPYAPEPYKRFTEVNMIDEANELLVGEQYWNFLGRKGTYDALLDVFEQVGRTFKEKVIKKMNEIGSVKKGKS